MKVASARPDVSPRVTKGCAVTPKRAARCVCFVREGHWNLLSCFTEKNLPLLLGTHSLTTGFHPLQTPPLNLQPLGFHPDHRPSHPQTLILPMSPKAYSHSHCGFDPSQQHQLTSLSFLKHFLLLVSVHHIFYLSLRLFFSVSFDSFPSQLSDLLKTEGPRAHRDFHST